MTRRGGGAVWESIVLGSARLGRLLAGLFPSFKARAAIQPEAKGVSG